LRQEDSSYLKAALETWPASIEVEFAPASSGLKSWAGFAFSLSSTPQTHESFRLGLSVDADKSTPVFLPSKRHRDDRIYAYLRGEPDWLPDESVLRLMYPLSQSMNGYDWYWRVELDNLKLNLIKWDGWQLAAIGDIAYSPDPEIGFRSNLGARINRGNTFVSFTEQTVSVGWSNFAD
jgi:hypothetical protein